MLSRSTHKSPHQTRVKGFTLVELIMVMVIIGTISAVVGPRFFDNQTFQNRFDYEDVRSALRFAQRYAVTTGCYSSFYFTGGSYTLFRDDDCLQATNYCFNVNITDPKDNNNYVGTPDGAVAPATVRLVFTPDGEVRNTNSVAACITDANLTTLPATTFTFTVSGVQISADYFTGYVR